MGYMTSQPVDSDRSCCEKPRYEKTGEDSAYTATQIVELMDEIHEKHLSEVDMWAELRRQLLELTDQGEGSE